MGAKRKGGRGRVAEMEEWRLSGGREEGGVERAVWCGRTGG